MKKKIILSVMLLVMVIVACVALVGCDNPRSQVTETREYHVKFDYSITSQFVRDLSFIMGSLITKPEIPTYINYTFNGGYGITQNGFISDSDIPITNPRMNEGYDANKNYRFVAWYTEPEYLYQWNFSEDRIWRNITLYAKWVEI